MHHTGIKTLLGRIIHFRQNHFNCTIQELKLLRFLESMRNKLIFQLHHTGIKTPDMVHVMNFSYEFQLHHTGIKTDLLTKLGHTVVGFQLHHTGIKTTGIEI